MPASVFLTAKFKVHNPSKRKQAALDTALEQYTYAYQYLLDWCRENLDTLEEKGQSNGRYRETLVRGQLPKRAGVAAFQLHSSVYACLLVDVAGVITGYLSLKRDNPETGFPTCRDSNPDGYPNALDEFASSIGDSPEENEKRDRLLKVFKGSVMPVYFGRPDAVPQMRNFPLLWDSQKERFSAVVYIAPKDRLEPLVPEWNLQRMGWASRTGDPEAPRPKLTASSRSALLLNLEMGRWHRGKFLDPSLAGEANVRSAFLSRDETAKCKAYYLHVTFEYAPEAIEPETYMGVDRGLANLIGITVIDKAGKILHQELHSGEELKKYQRHEFPVKKRLQKRGKDLTGRANVWRRDEEICHGLANTIVDVAKRYRSQVVMEYLVGFKERKRDFGALKRSPLQRIEQILDYKLPLASLLPLRTVGAAYTSQRCPKCDYTDGKNRVTQAEFRCQQCRYETHADLNGGHNIALKWLNRPSTKKASTLTAA